MWLSDRTQTNTTTYDTAVEHLGMLLVPKNGEQDLKEKCIYSTTVDNS